MTHFERFDEKFKNMSREIFDHIKKYSDDNFDSAELFPMMESIAAIFYETKPAELVD